MGADNSGKPQPWPYCYCYMVAIMFASQLIARQPWSQAQSFVLKDIVAAGGAYSRTQQSHVGILVCMLTSTAAVCVQSKLSVSCSWIHLSEQRLRLAAHQMQCPTSVGLLADALKTAQQLLLIW